MKTLHITGDWISVKDALPMDGRVVMKKHKDDYVHISSWYYATSKDCVKYWMPLEWLDL